MSDQSFKDLLQRTRTSFNDAANCERAGKNTEACQGYCRYLNLLDELWSKDEYLNNKDQYDEYVMVEARSVTEERVQHFNSGQPITDGLREQLQKRNQDGFHDDAHPDPVAQDQDTYDSSEDHDDDVIDETAEGLPPLSPLPPEHRSSLRSSDQHVYPSPQTDQQCTQPGTKHCNPDVDLGACAQSAAIPAQQGSEMRTSNFHCKAGTRIDELRTKAFEVGKEYNCDVQCTSSTVMTNPADVKVLFDKIQTTEVDAIVTSSNPKLNLKVGKGLPNVILKAAGVGIQEELHRNYTNGLQTGEVAKSGPGNISTCKGIYYGVLPICRKDKLNKDECCNALIMVVLNVLLMASSDGYTSVAFPALGTGNLGYPIQEVVQLMFLAVSQFFDCVVSPIQKVIFVVYPKADPFLKQLFLMEHFSRQFHTVKVDSLRKAHKELKKDPAKMCEARFGIGKTFLQISNGDIGSCFKATNVMLILWIEEYLDRSEENPVVSSFNESVQENIYSNYVPNLQKTYTEVEEDKTSFPATRLIHLHCKNDTDDAIIAALMKGIKQVKEDVAAITISTHSDGSRPWQPHIAANAIIKALQKVTSSHHVVQVILQESFALEPFLQTVLDHKFSVHMEPNVTKVFDTVFPLRESQLPIGDVVITVMPRSQDSADDTAKQSDKVAMELKREFGITLMYKMKDKHMN